jgi:hypothetical protein
MDISQTVAPKSDQMDYEDIAGSERIFTIKDVRQGPTGEQPVEIALEEFPRPWRPAKSMRRVLLAIWGPDGHSYVGKRVKLYGDPTVRFGGIAVGGIRIRALSGIDKETAVPLLIRKGQRAPYTVQPLPDAAPASQPRPVPTVDEIRQATSEDTLRGMWSAGGDQQEITRRVAELRAAVAPLPDPAPEGGAA